MHDIEHEYDQLFHEIEAQTIHGVEHTDVTYKMVPVEGKLHEVGRHVDVHEEDYHHGREAHHEAEGPSMYAWSIHDEPHHESIADMYRHGVFDHDDLTHGDHDGYYHHDADKHVDEHFESADKKAPAPKKETPKAPEAPAKPATPVVTPKPAPQATPQAPKPAEPAKTPAPATPAPAAAPAKKQNRF